MKVVQRKIKTVNYYTLMDLESLSVGDSIAFDVFIKKSNDYIIIIEAGTYLSQSLYAKLEKQPSLYIFKKDKEKLSITCESLKYYIKYNKDNLDRRIGFIYKINTQLFNNYLEDKYNKIDLECVNLIVKSILYLIKYDVNFLKNTIPHFINEHNLPNHSLHVAVYAMKLGNDLQLNSKKLLQLGAAALLHDLGIKKINESLINKSTKLEIAELEQVQKHVTYSVDIIKQNNIHDPYILDAVLHHHEQYDGNGYPEKREQGEIGVFASILAISDVFDALTSNRPHRKQYTSFEAIKMMLKDESMVNKFNRKYLQLLLKSL
ncbi:HD-GYP domain-containing protein [Sulfurimonas sp.]|uniref:HD-GYP domain-containing protein n=1 Tax=Sulfurimonas sp. TaxID=2022749 RepID=UPI003564D337